ncbi:class I SAM-dependent methyltransferase [bacterium]|nr:class I SAM-dependent methyltransferase [bacterium]
MDILHEIKDVFTYNLRFTERIARHACHNAFKKTLRDLELVGFTELHRKNVLDLGCGQRYPFALLCAAHGANVTALDISYVKPDILPLLFVLALKHNGFKRAIKSCFRRLLFDKHYYRVLEACAGKELLPFRKEIVFLTADPKKANYSLPSETFNLITSNAVLEHVADVSGFASEVKRMLRVGGYFYGYIHNFYSLSGGHNLGWAFPDENPSEIVPPWDHLLENRFPAHVYLNRYKPEQFEKAFSRHLEVKVFEARDVNHDAGGKEGERFLAGQVAKELAEYARELLLTRSYCIICQKT